MLKKTKIRKITLAQKLTLLLLVVFIGGISLSGIALAKILQYKTQHEISSNASLLFQSLNSVRSYTSNEVTPYLQANLGKDSFLPQTVPSYSSRKVFENLRQQNQEYQDFLYKEAMLNPTNIRDLADDFEKDIVSDFRQNKNTPEKTGFRNFQGEKYFYIARPLKITDSSCLRCHSTPDVAPQDMISIYGDKNGMGWQLNQINGTQIVSIPTSEVLHKAQESFFLIMGIVTLVFAIAIYMANFWLRRYVVRPIKRVVLVAEAVSTGNMDADFEQVSNDEVGSLVEAFTRMKLSLVMAIRRLEHYRLENREPKDKF
ncbi:putative sensor with HAMP domain protein [Calothrix sp. NIES-4101]|nr:putative sensor with HAMP domain protein [Calothrix sp. NIES-4101]